MNIYIHIMTASSNIDVQVNNNRSYTNNKFPFNRIDGKLPGQLNTSWKTERQCCNKYKPFFSIGFKIKMKWKVIYESDVQKKPTDILFSRDNSCSIFFLIWRFKEMLSYLKSVTCVKCIIHATTIFEKFDFWFEIDVFFYLGMQNNWST